MTFPRHTTFDTDIKRLVLQLGEFARDVIASLKERPVPRRLTVARYTATASTSSKIRIGAAGRPWAVELVRAVLAYDESAPITVTPTLNFAWDSTTNAIDVFEPSGLTADTVYKLQFLVWEE